MKLVRSPRAAGPRRARCSLLASFLGLTGLVCAPAIAEARPISRADIVRLVPAAPEASAARAKASGLRAAAKDAGAISLENPTLSAQAGPRIEDGTTRLALDAGLAVPVDLFGQRASRIEAAEAEAGLAEVGVRRATVAPLREALVLHAEALATRARSEVFARRLQLVEELGVAATRRRQAGEVAENDVALVRLQLARERSAAANLEGIAEALGHQLAATLGLPEGESAEATGPLVPTESPPKEAAPVAVVFAEAERTAARARLAREEAVERPTLSFLGGYEYDGGAHVITGGLAIPLPFYGVNDAQVAAARGDVAAADLQVLGARRHVSGQLASLRARAAATGRALEAMRPAADEARAIVARAQQAYTAGESDLPTLLLIRREALDTELGLVDAGLDHALATIELLLVQGAWSR